MRGRKPGAEGTVHISTLALVVLVSSFIGSALGTILGSVTAALHP
jgi:hypothetical protein